MKIVWDEQDLKALYFFERRSLESRVKLLTIALISSGTFFKTIYFPFNRKYYNNFTYFKQMLVVGREPWSSG